MDLSRIGRNDPCPCGSGKKFKQCHMGRENDIVADRINLDPAEVARLITRLPACDHPRAQEMCDSLELKSAAGKAVTVKLVDLGAYLDLGLFGQDRPQGNTEGGVLINYQKTRLLDPNHIYLALSPGVDDSTIVHQLAHVLDLMDGSRVPPGFAQALAREAEVPVELLEHPQEYGDMLLKLCEQFEVELDAEDEIVAYLARHKVLIPGPLVANKMLRELKKHAELAVRVLQDNKQEIDARIRSRAGYKGKQA